MIDIADRFRHGGQAFPSERWEGMSLRDWFAGQMLAGAAQEYNWTLNAALVVRCYQVADLMLAERIKDE